MVTRSLEQLGLFVGWRKPYENEAIFFVRLNNWLLRECGGTWDNPAPIRQLWKNQEVRSSAVEYVRFVMQTPWAASYLGVPRYIRYRSIFRLSRPWGWKDPRNTYTLPLWLDLFPEAKVLHVYRNGVDVANSLMVRAARSLDARRAYLARKGLRILPARSVARGSSGPSVLRCSSLDGAFSLWEEYCQEARRHVEALNDRAIEVRFEDFLVNPASTIVSLAHYCGLSVDRSVVADISEQLRPSRAFAYRGNPKLCAFAEQVADRLAAYGYFA